MKSNSFHNTDNITKLFIHINKFIKLIVVIKIIIMTADLTVNIALNLFIQINKFVKFTEFNNFINLFTLKKLLATEAPKAFKINIVIKTTILITASLTSNNIINSPIQNNKNLSNSVVSCC